MGCNFKEDLDENTEIIDDGANLPIPKLDISVTRLINEYRERYKVDAIRFSRPYYRESGGGNIG